jgi:conjugal transfer pilus assembly protein TraW
MINFNASKLFLSAILTSIAYLCSAESIHIGRVYPVVEGDFRDEFVSGKIENKIKDFDIKKSSALSGFPLPKNDTESTFVFTPFYSTTFDVFDKDGNLIYPKGYTFNIADYVTLPNRIIFFDDSQIDFVTEHYQEGDLLILDDGDIFNVSDDLGKPVFLLEEGFLERYKVTGTPTILDQTGQQFRRVNHVY